MRQSTISTLNRQPTIRRHRRCHLLRKTLITFTAISSCLGEGMTALPGIADFMLWTHQLFNKDQHYTNSESFVSDNPYLMVGIVWMLFSVFITDWYLEGRNFVNTADNPRPVPEEHLDITPDLENGLLPAPF